jgi:hypothetical protein
MSLMKQAIDSGQPGAAQAVASMGGGGGGGTSGFSGFGSGGGSGIGGVGGKLSSTKTTDETPLTIKSAIDFLKMAREQFNEDFTTMKAEVIEPIIDARVEKKG